MRTIRYHSILLCFMLLSFQVVKGQDAQGITQVIAKIDTFNSRLPAEKLYLQMDKPYYAVGDTIWFKAYLLNASLSYSPLSSRLYVELLNDSSKLVRRMALPLTVGITWGNISLEGVREGGYRIRAYTNWMRNFGEDYFFNRSFYVASPQKQTWLVNTNTALTGLGAGTVNMDIRFSSLDSRPTGLRDLQLRVTDGKKVLFKGAEQTTAEGLLRVSFPLPDKGVIKNLRLLAQEKGNNNPRAAVIPVNANRARDIDLQFMPEGGYMVAGLPAHVAFKAIGDDGRGVNISGTIVNATSGQEVLAFQSLHKGIGSVDLAPQAGDVYVARIKLADGQTREVSLPAVRPSGTSLRVRNLPNRDSLDVYVYLSPDLVKPNNVYYLVGISRGISCFGAAVPAGKPFAAVRVSKGLFPTGIAHLALLNTAGQPLNERLTFINRKDNLKVSLSPGSQKFAPRDSVPLTIAVNDAAGKPVQGSFSIAVTDDSQVRADSLATDNILSRFLITSELKGYVEDAAWYFGATEDAWQALDGLLLTQGWVGYNWSQVNNLPKPAFAPEHEYTVAGKVTNLVGKGIEKAEVLLMSTGKYRFIKDTTTNADGRFVFRGFPPVDSVTFVLQAVNKRKKVINAGITIDETLKPAVTPGAVLPAKPWYVNADPTLLNYVSTNSKYHAELDKLIYGPAGRMLNTVTVKNTAIVKGSKNLNGAGDADQVIDEQTIVDADKTTLGDLLQQKVKGYRIGYPRKSNNLDFFIKDKRARFVFDGIDIKRFYEPIDNGVPTMNEYYNYVKNYLDYFTAEDIKGIEVSYSLRRTSNYNARNLTTEELLAENPAGAMGSSSAYIEITTRAGNGPFSARATGIYVYKPMLLTLPKEFYRPRYAVKNANPYADLRSTIHWQPTIVTDKNGQALVSFYAADRPATYTVILEGADLNGRIGYQTQKITIGSGPK